MFARLSSRRRSLAVLIAFAFAAAGLIGTASPAAAATCDPGDDGAIAVFLAEDPSASNSLAMRGGNLIVDGTNCGAPVGAVVVMDFSATTAANKRITIDATESWEDIFVVMLLESVPEEGTGDLIFAVGAEYDLSVTTSAADEEVRLVDSSDGGIIQVRIDSVPHLQLGVINDPIDLTMRLGGGDDVFNQLGSFNNPLITGLEVSGNAGNDMLFGTALGDNLKGGSGADEIVGRGGNDTIRGHSGADDIRGGSGDDVIRAGSGDDVVRGNGGADNIRGQGGDDDLRGGGGPDFVHGGGGRDDIKGNSGNDTFKTNNDGAVDSVSGGRGTDTCDRCDATDNVSRSVENA